jgi:hypothetical protein
MFEHRKLFHHKGTSDHRIFGIVSNILTYLELLRKKE